MFLYSLIIFIFSVFSISVNSFFQVSFNLKVILYMKKGSWLRYFKEVILQSKLLIFSNLFGFLCENMNAIHELILSLSLHMIPKLTTQNFWLAICMIKNIWSHKNFIKNESKHFIFINISLVVATTCFIVLYSRSWEPLAKSAIELRCLITSFKV